MTYLDFTYLGLFPCLDVQNNFMIRACKNCQKRGKNHNSTNNDMSNDGSSIEIMDLSDRDQAVLTLKNFKVLKKHFFMVET